MPPAVLLAAAVCAQSTLDPRHHVAEIVEDLPTSPGYGVTGQARPRPIEIRSLPTLAHCFPRSFTFYVAHPIRSVRRDRPPTSLAKSRNALCILWYHVHNF